MSDIVYDILLDKQVTRGVDVAITCAQYGIGEDHEVSLGINGELGWSSIAELRKHKQLSIDGQPVTLWIAKSNHGDTKVELHTETL